jgi:ABC-type glycerol-3-phosphate transport system permease component
MVLVPFAIINMREGLANLDGEMIEMAKSFTRSRARRFFKVILPLLYPFIFATIRISFGVAWKVALTAELFGGNTGLGYLLNLANGLDLINHQKKETNRQQNLQKVTGPDRGFLFGHRYSGNLFFFRFFLGFFRHNFPPC